MAQIYLPGWVGGVGGLRPIIGLSQFPIGLALNLPTGTELGNYAVTNVVKTKTVQLSFQFHPPKVIIGLSLVVDYESSSSALEKLTYLI